MYDRYPTPQRRAQAIRRVRAQPVRPAPARHRDTAGAGAGWAGRAGVVTRAPVGLDQRDVLQLQQVAGNRAVDRLLARGRHAAGITPGAVKDVAVHRQEVRNQFYGHGAFMGAARRMLNDAMWNRILRTLMPDVYADVTGVTDESELIPMLENNPVMAAYGMFATRRLDRRREGGRSDRVAQIKAIEWDVWLNPEVVDRIVGYRRVCSPDLERQLDRLLVDKMIIAHGTGTQTVMENMGIRQYDEVRGNAKSDLGGVRPGAWMDMFGRAMRLATADNFDELADQMSREKRHSDPDDPSRDQTFQKEMSFSKVIELYRKEFDKDAFSVLLDIKSRTPPAVLHRLIRELNRRGVHVHAMGSFTFSELAGLGQVDQDVDGRQMGAPTAIKFFHGIGNLQNSCLNGNVMDGDTVMFNAGSLLDSVKWKADKPDDTDQQILNIVKELGEFKRAYGFRLGLYVQENDADRRAATKITEFSNRYPSIFDLGFAWGGISNDMGRLTDGGTGIGSQAILSSNWKGGRAPEAGFSSIFEIQRGRRSREFSAKRGYVVVESRADWDPVPGTTTTYTITLRRSRWYGDKTYKTFSFEVGRTQVARWDTDVDKGTYYLDIAVSPQTSTTLKGNIKVST